MKLERREAVDGPGSIDRWDQQLVTLVAEYLLHKSISDTSFVWIVWLGLAKAVNLDRL